MTQKYQFKNYSAILKTGLIMSAIVLGILFIVELSIIVLFLTFGHQKMHSIEIIIIVFTVFITIAFIWNCLLFKNVKSKLWLGIYYMLLITVGFAVFFFLFVYYLDSFLTDIKIYYPNYIFWPIAEAIIPVQVIVGSIGWGLLISMVLVHCIDTSSKFVSLVRLIITLFLRNATIFLKKIKYL